jgi:hypothetical protein
VASIGGIPTFVCNGKPVLKPVFETYVPTRHYFRQFADAGTEIFGFSTNAIFLNCFQVTGDQRRAIEGKLKCDGKHLLWCSAAGWFSEAGGSSHLCRELTGFNLIRSRSEFALFVLKSGSERRLPGVGNVAVLESGTWTSLWTPKAAMPAAHYRQLAKAAGILMTTPLVYLVASQSLAAKRLMQIRSSTP